MRFFLITVLGFFAFSASAGEYLTTGNRTTQPIGHYEFCKANPAECRIASPAREPLPLTRQLWARIIEINNLVNTTVTPRTDEQIWGLKEVWSYPDGVGDCEDFVLAKRRLLNYGGVPLSHLLITVVRRQNSEGHAVLVVRTNFGDFVLDNLESRVLLWEEVPYKFLKQQSPRHTGAWVSIDDQRQLLAAKQ